MGFRPPKWLLPLAGFAGLALAALAFRSFIRPAPEEALRRFHAQLSDGQTAEDQLMCPLVLAGPAACPAIRRDVEDSKPLRRYAIGALRSLRCRDAIPLLYAILRNESEEDYFRADALEALWLIEESPPEVVAASFANRSDSLGQMAQLLLRGYRPDAMTFVNALFCAHD
jgi:hypothetical protein